MDMDDYKEHNNIKNNHEHFMRMALELAKEAFNDDETPVGAVVVSPAGKVIGRGRNRREKEKRTTAHAEIEAINDACAAFNDWRLTDCAIYVTLEPCPMCAGAILGARIYKLFYGARDEITGSCGSVTNIFMEPYGHKVQITGGILSADCGMILSDFFRQRRSREDA